MAIKPTEPRKETLLERMQNPIALATVAILFILFFGMLLIVNWDADDRTADQIAKAEAKARNDKIAAETQASMIQNLNTTQTTDTNNAMGLFGDIFNIGEGQSTFGRVFFITLLLFGVNIFTSGFGRRRIFGFRLNGIAGLIFCQH